MKDKPKLELVKAKQAGPLPNKPGYRSKHVVFIPRLDGGIDLVEFGTYYKLVLQKPVSVDLEGRAVSYEPSPET